MKRKTVRITLDLGPVSSELLTRLQEELGETKVGVFKRSLEVLDRIRGAIEAGYSVKLTKGEEEIPVEIIGLNVRPQHVAPRAQLKKAALGP